MLRKPRHLWRLVSLPLSLLAAALLAHPQPSSLDGSEGTRGSTWSLEEALLRARRESPAIREAEADVEAAEAELLTARTYPHNPEIDFEAAERSGPAETSNDRGVELGQEIEIGGQRRKRVRAAEADLDAAESIFKRAEQELTHRVELAFAQALAEERRVEIARAELDLVDNLLSFETRRLEAGAGTQLDLNLARAAAGRARQLLEEAVAARAVARSALAEAVGSDPANPPVPVGSGPGPIAELVPLEELVERALAARPDLAANRDVLESARRRVKLQRSVTLPNLRASVFRSREEGDEITGAAIGIVLPLFDRNQGGIASAKAEATRASAALASAELAVRRSVAEAYARYEAAAAASEALGALVVGTLEESLMLLERALEAGKVSAGDVLVLRRELVEAQRQYVQAALDLAEARADLWLAVGDPSLPLRNPNPSTPGDR